MDDSVSITYADSVIYAKVHENLASLHPTKMPIPSKRKLVATGYAAMGPLILTSPKRITTKLRNRHNSNIICVEDIVTK